MRTPRPLPALDALHADPLVLAGLGRLAVITNQSVTTRSGVTAVEAVKAAAIAAPHIGSSGDVDAGSVNRALGKPQLVKVFGPQHGYWQTEQDNMLETRDSFITLDDGESLPVYSLYSNVRAPTKEQLADVDTLLVDLPDIGVRVYTYIWTLYEALKAVTAYANAVESPRRTQVIVLDRPNPLGLRYKDGERWKNVEGPMLGDGLYSFSGSLPIPFRHGLTIGELGKYFTLVDPNICSPSLYGVLRVQSLLRKQPIRHILEEYCINLASPNMPTWQNVAAFPVTVMLEGTNASEGRGTTMPFNTIGAPWCDLTTFSANIRQFHTTYSELLGSIPTQYRDQCTVGCAGGVQVYIRPHCFVPTFNKWKGVECKGIHMRFIVQDENPDEAEFGPVAPLAAAVITALGANSNGGEKLVLPKGRYEYNAEDSYPFDNIMGDKAWRIALGLLQSESTQESGVNTIVELLHSHDHRVREFSDHSLGAEIYS